MKKPSAKRKSGAKSAPIVIMRDHCSEFAENKDDARRIRELFIKPEIKQGAQRIVLDFTGIDSSTQSFIHALISEVFQERGEKALKLFEFKGCSTAVKSLIGTVVNYSLE